MYDGKVSAALMQSLYDLWGGRPRYVLEKANDAVHQYQLEAMIGSCNAMEVVQGCGEHRGRETTSDRWALYHLSHMTYESCCLSFP